MTTVEVNANIENAENLFIQYKLAHTGTFFTRLCSAIEAADQDNKACLSLAFPFLVIVINKFQTDHDYWPVLKNKYLTAYPHLKYVL